MSGARERIRRVTGSLYWRQFMLTAGMVLLTLALLTAIVLRCVYVARHAKTQLESYVCIGVAGMIIFQVIVNVGMCLFVMPVIGLTLPFISYGGSSILFLLIEMGLVMSVARGIKVRDV